MKSADSMYKSASDNFSRSWDLCHTLHFLGVRDTHLNVSKISWAGQTNTLSVAKVASPNVNVEMDICESSVFAELTRRIVCFMFHSGIWTGSAVCGATGASEPAPAEELGQLLIMLIVVSRIKLAQVVTDFPWIFS
jgi:hypothetical protein